MIQPALLGHQDTSNLNGNTPHPITYEQYLREEQEFEAGRRPYDEIRALRIQFNQDAANLPAMIAEWDAQDVRRHQAPAEIAPVPVRRFATPIPDNMNTRGNLARLIDRYGPMLLIALPDPGDPPDSPSDIYGVEPNGILTMIAARSFYESVQTQYLRDATPPPDEEGKKRSPTSSRVYLHALNCNTTGEWRELCKEAASAIHYWQREGIDLLGLEIRRKSDADSDLSVIGTPHGVLDLYTGWILRPEEGRKRFVTASIPDPYNPKARHPACDAVLPSWGGMKPGSRELYRARGVSRMMTTSPRRELMVEICDAGSGKSTFSNALQTGFGPSYVNSIAIEQLLEPRVKSRVPNEHNGELGKFTHPMRILFSSEAGKGGRLDADLVKRVTGSDAFVFRVIREKPVTARASAHLWIQGNAAEDGTLELGLSDADENAQALQERAKLLTRQAIPEGQRVLEWVDLGYQDTDEARIYRQSVVARVVEYCVAFASLGWPEDLPEMEDLLREQIENEQDLWETDWLPYHIAQVEGAVTTTERVYQDYLAFEMRNEPQNMKNNLKTQKAITNRVGKFHGIRATKTRLSAADGGRVVSAFRDLALVGTSLFPGDFDP